MALRSSKAQPTRVGDSEKSGANRRYPLTVGTDSRHRSAARASSPSTYARPCGDSAASPLAGPWAANTLRPVASSRTDWWMCQPLGSKLSIPGTAMNEAW
jgi:hypothetical protein